MADIRNPSEWREQNHPTDSYLRPDVFPTVWCSGCGIGTALYGYLEASREAEIPPEKLRVVCGTGCTGAVAQCLNIKSYSITDRSPVRFAAELKQRRPDLTVSVFLNNADLMISGAADLRDVGRRNVPLIVICVNNFVYAVGRDSASALTPYMRPSLDRRFELPFNLPHMALAYGAKYTARWTPLRAGWFKESIRESFGLSGLSLIEMISPCLIYDVGSGRILDSVDRMKFYNDHSEIRFREPASELDIRRRKKLILGVFGRSGMEMREDRQ